MPPVKSLRCDTWQKIWLDLGLVLRFVISGFFGHLVNAAKGLPI